MAFGIYLWFWLDKRHFYRRNVAGLEEFDSYFDMWKKRIKEYFVKTISGFLLFFGTWLIIMGIADREGVDLRLYRVIYNAIEDVEAAMKGMLDPVFEEKVLGHAEVRQTFKASGVGAIAGSYVQDGTFERNCSVRLTRDGIVIFDGPLASLKRFKDDVKEVRAGYECGFVFENYNDIKEGDLVEAYKMVEIERK